MICGTCIAEGKTSRVFDYGSSTTLLNCRPFYDEQGRHHTHDSNTTTTEYRCSNGHSWTDKSTGSCWCGWPDKEKQAAPAPPFVTGMTVTGEGPVVVGGPGLAQPTTGITLAPGVASLTWSNTAGQQRLLDVTARLRAVLGLDESAKLEDLLEAALKRIEEKP